MPPWHSSSGAHWRTLEQVPQRAARAESVSMILRGYRLRRLCLTQLARNDAASKVDAGTFRAQHISYIQHLCMIAYA